LAVIGWGTIALLFVVPLFLFRLPPAMISLPNREYWLASDERRVYALDRLAEYLGWTAAATAALLAVAIELAIRANLHETAFADGPFLVFLGAYFAFVLGATIWMLRTFSIGNLEASL
jgi:hypothetical protein